MFLSAARALTGTIYSCQSPGQLYSILQNSYSWLKAGWGVQRETDANVIANQKSYLGTQRDCGQAPDVVTAVSVRWDPEVYEYDPVSGSFRWGSIYCKLINIDTGDNLHVYIKMY